MPYTFDLRDQDLYETHLRLYPNAVAALQIPEGLPESLSFLVWGVIVDHPQRHPSLVEQLPDKVRSCFPTPLYVAGWGVVTFPKITRGHIVVGPFAPRITPGDMKPLYDATGGVQFVQRWDGPDIADFTEHVLEFQLEQPRAYMQIGATVSDPITLTIDPADCVTFQASCDEFDRYEHDWHRTRQLQKAQFAFGLSKLS